MRYDAMFRRWIAADEGACETISKERLWVMARHWRLVGDEQVIGYLVWAVNGGCQMALSAFTRPPTPDHTPYREVHNGYLEESDCMRNQIIYQRQ
jgi:hypothetical protein